MKKVKYIALILLGLLLLTSGFYWYQFRPAEVRRTCAEEATNDVVSKSRKNDSYRECLVKHGLKPESIFEKAETITIKDEPDTSRIESEIENLQYSLEEQNRARQQEFQNQVNCESNSGKYQGNGLCVYY